MVFRKLNNEHISLLGFGGLRLPLLQNRNEIDIAKAEEMIDYAITRGINYFDTAYTYHTGKSESVFGDILSKHSRNSYNLATKMPLIHIKSQDDAEHIFAEQLNKCKVEFFDFYLIHNINKTSWESNKYWIYEHLREKQRQGFIRHLGFSFHDKPDLLQETVNRFDWDFVQIQLNYMDWDLQNAKMQYQILKEKGVPIIVMEPVRGGMLASLCEKSIKILREENDQASTASWAIRYSASFPEVLTVLSGMSNMQQLSDNIATLEHFKPLSQTEYKKLERALKVFQKSMAVPCTGCRYCIECPVMIDIPSMMATYNNYLISGKYKRNSIYTFLFRYDMQEEKHQAHNCIKCKRCMKQCPQHINIPLFMNKVSKLYTHLNRLLKVKKLMNDILRKREK